VGWGKVVCFSTKAAISLKRIKIEEQLLRVAYRNSPTLIRTVPFPAQYSEIFWYPYYFTRFIFGWYIYRIHPNKSAEKPIKHFGERGAWAYLGTDQFWGYPYYLRNG